MSQQNQPYSNQPWSQAGDGPDVSPWAQRDGQPGFGGHAPTPPDASFPADHGAVYGPAPTAGTSAYGGTAPYGQSYAAGGPAGGPMPEPYGQAPAQQYGTQHHGTRSQPHAGQPPYGSQPDGTPPYGSQQYGPTASPQYPPTAYGQPPYPGQPFGYPAPAQSRPAWKTVVGILLAIWTGLALISALSRTGSLIAGAAGRGAAYQLGSLIGVLLMIVLPGVLAWLLLRRKR